MAGVSAKTLITQARRRVQDVPKSIRVAREADGEANLFNLAYFPIIEGSAILYISGSPSATTAGYSLDLDSGDLTLTTAPDSGDEVASQHKYAHWRDQHWIEAIGEGVDTLNARGFFKQVVNSGIVISAGTLQITAPSACVDVYSIKKKQTSAHFAEFPYNWTYQQDANKILLASSPYSAVSASFSYLRQLQKPTTTGSVLDVPSAAIEPVRKYAESQFYRSYAGKIAKQGNATIDEGHFRFTNLRAMANDLLSEFDSFTTRAKPTRPAKDVQWHIAGAGRV